MAQSVKRPTSARSRSRVVREFEPRVGLWTDGSEPGACFRFCVSLSLCPSPVHALSLSVPKIKIKTLEKKLKKKKRKGRIVSLPHLPQAFVTLRASPGHVGGRISREETRGGTLDTKEGK